MLVPISKACDVLGVCAKTLRRWEARKYLIPYCTPGNHRRYDYDALVEFRESYVYGQRPEQKNRVAAVYGRVSSQKQRVDLERQVEFLTAWARQDGFAAKVYTDIGSGMNDGAWPGGVPAPCWKCSRSRAWRWWRCTYRRPRLTSRRSWPTLSPS